MGIRQEIEKANRKQKQKQNQKQQTIKMGNQDRNLFTQRESMVRHYPRRTMRSHSISPPIDINNINIKLAPSPPTLTNNTKNNTKHTINRSSPIPIPIPIPIPTQNKIPEYVVCHSDPLPYLYNYGNSLDFYPFMLPDRSRGGGKYRRSKRRRNKTKKSIKKNKNITRKSRNNNNSGYNASNSSITTFISDKSNTNSATEIYQGLQSGKRSGSRPPIRSAVVMRQELIAKNANTKPKNNSNNYSSNCSSLTESSNGTEVPEPTTPRLHDLANASAYYKFISERNAERDTGHRHQKYHGPYTFHMNH